MSARVCVREREDLQPRHDLNLLPWQRDAPQLLLDLLHVHRRAPAWRRVERVGHQVVAEHDDRHQHLSPNTPFEPVAAPSRSL